MRQPCEGYIGELRCRFLRPANNHVKELGSKFPISQAMRWPQPWITTWCSLLRSPESQPSRKGAPGFLNNRNYIINVSCFKLLNYSSNILLINITSQGTVHNTSKTVPILSLQLYWFLSKDWEGNGCKSIKISSLSAGPFLHFEKIFFKNFTKFWDYVWDGTN